MLFILFPTQVMSLATKSDDVIQLGADYLVITSVSMFAVACVASMSVGLRAMHKPGISTFFSGIGILSNVFLNWIFIFGKFGVPPMGIKGAAIATVLSGAIEVGTLYGYLYFKSICWRSVSLILKRYSIYNEWYVFSNFRYLPRSTFLLGREDCLPTTRSWGNPAFKV